jgi:hypothetical protein
LKAFTSGSSTTWKRHSLSAMSVCSTRLWPMRDVIEAIVSEVGRVLLGKEDKIRLALACLLSDGHLLIEDVDLGEGWLHVRGKPELGWSVKTGRERRIPLIEESVRVLRQAIGDRAMEKVEWPGRLQRLTEGDLKARAPEGAELWLDGGHNPGAGMAIAEAMAGMEERDSRPLYLIAGMISTKDQAGYFRHFVGMARHVFTVPVKESEAGVPNDELAARAMEAGLTAEPISSVGNALDLLRESGGADEPPPRILICGSLYLIGAVLAENGTPPT